MRSRTWYATSSALVPSRAGRGASTRAHFCNWRPMLSDQRFPLLKRQLRIRYGIDHGWELGLRGPPDIKTEAKDRTFPGRLMNTGSAVGVLK
jgi:hypothetical protein